MNRNIQRRVNWYANERRYPRDLFIQLSHNHLNNNNNNNNSNNSNNKKVLIDLPILIIAPWNISPFNSNQVGAHRWSNPSAGDQHLINLNRVRNNDPWAN